MLVCYKMPLTCRRSGRLGKASLVMPQQHAVDDQLCGFSAHAFYPVSLRQDGGGGPTYRSGGKVYAALQCGENFAWIGLSRGGRGSSILVRFQSNGHRAEGRRE